VYERGAQRRRRVSEEAGEALEILGHAIAYITDGIIGGGRQFKLADPRIQAALLMIEKSKEIYLACPEVPSIAERIRSWFRAA
jgi:hypothetical protein